MQVGRCRFDLSYDDNELRCVDAVDWRRDAKKTKRKNDGERVSKRKRLKEVVGRSAVVDVDADGTVNS